MQVSMRLPRLIGVFLVLSMASLLSATTLADFSATDIDGKTVPLANYSGKVVLVVNTASRCGFTPQYDGLEAIYKEYQERGLVVLGFPSNDFLGQEPGTNEEIKAFCTGKYNVSFPLFGKVEVVGQKQDPLYRWLTSKDSNPRFAGKITWNFNKFLIGRDGVVVARFDSAVKPESSDVRRAIEAALTVAQPTKNN